MWGRVAKWSDSHRLTRLGRRRLAGAPLVSRAVAAADRRRVRRIESEGQVTERSKARWREAPPDPGLTWGEEVSGGPAVEAATAHGVFGAGRTVLEVGPGYGRVLGAALSARVEFERYVGVDLSKANVAHLRKRFDDPRIEIVHGDAETFALGDQIDSVISFLTFKHLYPSFAGALVNLAGQVRPGGRIVFDLIEGPREYFHRDQVTFVREYDRHEAAEIVQAAGLELVTIDRVEHAPGRTRMLIVAAR